MTRVGQRYLAWCAYERAIDMKDRFWGDPHIQRGFVEHCRARQAVIERGLPEQERAALRPRFRAELEHGREYQRAYQAYEAEQVAAGASIDDPHFYDKFYERHGRIASPVGDADRFVTEHFAPIPQARPSVVLFFAGLFALAAAFLFRRRPRPAVSSEAA